jgi:predicted PurR-regulated permease PerM
MIKNLQNIATSLKDGSLTIPMPSEKVANIPLIGHKLHDTWAMASQNLEETVSKYAPQIKSLASFFLKAAGGILSSLAQFVAAIIIAGIFLAHANGSVKATHIVFTRLFAQKGVEWANLSAATIRSVVQGVLGIAVIQATLAAIGLFMVDMPAAALLSVLVLFVAIIQLPPLLILGPAAAYVFSYADNSTATIFLIYSVLVSMSDGFLKPFLLGRGVDIPMLVILIGAIGGMIISGIIGLFLGAVILALAYKLFVAWLNENPQV